MPCDELGPAELSRIGFVPQEDRLLEWMTVEQHLRYVASFYASWDSERETRLRRELELEPEPEPDTLVGALSSGNLQKLVIVLAVCHTTRRFERERAARRRATTRAWRGHERGTSSRSWLLATIHESRRGLGWRGLPSLLRGMPAVLAVLALHAAGDTSDGSFLEAMARTVYDVVLRSPHTAPLGKEPPYLMIPLVIAAVGVALAVLEPLTLSSSLLYPLSRREETSLNDRTRSTAKCGSIRPDRRRGEL